ncbi:hypothetical protein GOARA_013_00270 [Gordonia araii NBRC 100433]|uniref:Uncharacterized protein n=1 Tax=Gordonia araii NBRC 100433 TaxID=1073574 RepID=G7GYA8_9ACTN|nr:hypothetical protein [Gordonia araii]NNG97419.1 hypothetical protein [Gordonia araii NBRC 100433]GAB08583.1 hypothetical protein GOARA_013_00270 [Gordonia araii NBRC 100433]
MERLVPPVVDAEPPQSVVVEIPNEGIGRNALLRAYKDAMVRPVPDGKSLDHALKAWSGILGAAPWFRAAQPTTALALRSPVVRSDEPTFREALAAVTAFVDPLSRYSAGWCDSLKPLRWNTFQRPLSDAVHEARRYGARRVHDDMAARERAMTDQPAVQESEESLRAFLRDPSVRHARDEQIALNGFATKIAELVDLGGTRTMRLTDEERDLLIEWEERLVDDFDAAPTRVPTEEELDRYHRVAVAFLERAFAEADIDGFTHDDVNEAFRRLVVSAVNRQIIDRPLDGLERAIRPRIRAVAADDARKRHRQRETAFIAGDDRTAGGAHDRFDALPEGAERAADIVAIAATLIERDPALLLDGRPCWEAHTAHTLLTQPHLAADSPRRFVLDAWSSGVPPHARSASAPAAAMDVLLIMRTAVARATLEADGIDEGQRA